MSEQWPSAGRMVHVNIQGHRHVPAVILETPDRMDQPAQVIRVQLFPVNEFPVPLTLDNAGQQEVWHWPEYVGPGPASDARTR